MVSVKPASTRLHTSTMTAVVTEHWRLLQSLNLPYRQVHLRLWMHVQGCESVLLSEYKSREKSFYSIIPLWIHLKYTRSSHIFFQPTTLLEHKRTAKPRLRCCFPATSKLLQPFGWCQLPTRFSNGFPGLWQFRPPDTTSTNTSINTLTHHDSPPSTADSAQFVCEIVFK